MNIYNRQIVEGIEQCFKQANKQYQDVRTLLLAGDAIPILDPFLSTFDITSKISQSSVVIGAASYAHRSLSRPSDSRYFYYGIGLDDIVVPMINNSDAGPKQILLSPLPQQKVVYIDVYEISYLLAKKNVCLARIQVDWFPFFEESVIKVMFEISQSILKVSVYVGERLLSRTVVNNVDDVAFAKSLGGKPSGLRLVSEAEPSKLQFAPYIRDPSPTEVYFNMLMDIYSCSESFSKRVSKQLVEGMANRFSYHLTLVSLWNAITKLWQVEGCVSVPLSNHRSRNVQLLKRLETILGSEVLDAGSLNDIKIEFKAEMISLDAVANSTEDIKSERKTMIDSCNMCISVCEMLTGNQPIGDRKLFLSSTIVSILTLLDSSSLQLPSYISSMFLTQARSCYKNMVSLSTAYESIVLDNQVRGLIPAEQASYANLFNIAGQINGFIAEQHERVLRLPIVVDNGQIRPQDNKDCFIHEEHLLKVLIQLDNVSIHDQPILRTTRKSLVNHCQVRLNQIDSLKSLHKANN